MTTPTIESLRAFNSLLSKDKITEIVKKHPGVLTPFSKNVVAFSPATHTPPVDLRKSLGLPYPIMAENSISLGRDLEIGRRSYLSTGMLVTHADLGVQYSPYQGFSPEEHVLFQEEYITMIEEVSRSIDSGEGGRGVGVGGFEICLHTDFLQNQQ